MILGHADALREDALWAAVLDDASARRCLLKAHSPVRIWFNSAVEEKALPPEAAPAAEKAAAAKPAAKAAAAKAAAKPAAAAAKPADAAASKRPRRGRG